jgi:hypothetical protein
MQNTYSKKKACMNIVGVDFTSTPRRAKPIAVAHGRLEGARLHLMQLVAHGDWQSYESWLAQPGPWLGAFDFPFGMARELVEQLGWPQRWDAMVTQCAQLTRAELRSTFKAFCDARPIGNKFAHRATDAPARASPSMKWVNPPVAYMFHEGTRRLLHAGVTVFGLHAADPQRIALEGYPGLLARAITRASYKSDDRAKQTVERRGAREGIVDALVQGAHPFEIVLDADSALRAHLIDDGSADLLDAVLCAVTAAWASRQPNYGLPLGLDPLEGWISGAGHSAFARPHPPHTR